METKMMTPQVAALRIGRGLAASEDGIDTVLAEMGGLVSAMTGARVHTRSPAATGHRAIARIVSAQAKLVEARSDLIRAHEDLRRIAETADTPTSCPDRNSAEILEGQREVA
jgi:hypothetical protein